MERQQIKWFAYAAFLLGLWLSFDMVTELPQPWESMKESAFLTMPPLAIGIAILRYRLWDIDFVIRKTLIYGALSLSLALIYFGSVLLLQALFLAITGQGRSPIAAVISTLAIAALFTPLRRRIQNDIDRRFYRQKYDARRIAEEFATRARDEVELDVLTGHLIESVEKTLQPDHVSLWLRKGKG